MHTGDAGTMDDEGFLYIQDRVKDMIVSGGENVYPREIEEVLYKHPAIAEAAIIGVPDAKWGETVKAIVVLKQTPARPPTSSWVSAAASSPATSSRARSTSSPRCRATRAARC